jgi:hypothetical protein
MTTLLLTEECIVSHCLLLEDDAMLNSYFAGPYVKWNHLLLPVYNRGRRLTVG